MEKTKLKLKPCPFCGGAAEPFVRLRATGKTHVVGCRNIGCGVSVETDEYDTQEEAAEAWNGRPVYRWLLATADGIDGALSNCGPSRRYVDVNVDYLAKIAQDLRAAACGDFADSKIALKMQDLKSGIEHLKQAKAHMSKANGIMSNCISKLRELEEENERLKDELSALQIQPDASYMKLPVDADGIAIRPGDKIYFSGDPEGFALKCIAVGWPPCPVEFVDWEETGTTAWEEGSAFTHRQPNPEPADSWEKLEEDTRKQSCSYFGLDLPPALCEDCPHGSRQTGRACWQNARLDMIARAKKLAGIEEEEQR